MFSVAQANTKKRDPLFGIFIVLTGSPEYKHHNACFCLFEQAKLEFPSFVMSQKELFTLLWDVGN